MKDVGQLPPVGASVDPTTVLAFLLLGSDDLPLRPGSRETDVRDNNQK
ncbi:MAG TPA: hypothetical protein VHI54_01500 [Actinomycetota bacterium]|nr:hypothetical protein [Actinomycetota bacterium]